jgi:orotidine-5'-phosphate decarboxylase
MTSACADRFQRSIQTSGSYLVAGLDPVIEKLPDFLIASASSKSKSDSEFFERVLRDLSEIFVSAVAGKVAAAKPNIAFYEQYGLAGLKAFEALISSLRNHSIPVIIDAKRGDIGSTASAYSAAFLATKSVCGRRIEAFECDALTVNPYLGFDTLLPFLNDCKEYGKGIFVLVQTSNPGAKDLQGLIANSESIADHVARWLADNAATLMGDCGWSALGAVVGASYPQDAKQLRERMPRNFFLIPGLGAQGASSHDSVAGFGKIDGAAGGALINVSRGLLEGHSQSVDELRSLITNNVTMYNTRISDSLKTL